MDSINTAEEIRAKGELLRVRSLLKQVQQVSWNINQFEKQYPLDLLNSVEEINSAIDTYLGLLDDIREVIKKTES